MFVDDSFLLFQTTATRARGEAFSATPLSRPPPARRRTEPLTRANNQFYGTPSNFKFFPFFFVSSERKIFLGLESLGRGGARRSGEGERESRRGRGGLTTEGGESRRNGRRGVAPREARPLPRWRTRTRTRWRWRSRLAQRAALRIEAVGPREPQFLVVLVVVLVVLVVLVAHNGVAGAAGCFFLILKRRSR